MPGLQTSSAGAPLCIPALGEEDGPAGATATTSKDVELYNSTSSTLQLISMQLSGGIFDFTPNFANGTTCPTPGVGASPASPLVRPAWSRSPSRPSGRTAERFA